MLYSMALRGSLEGTVQRIMRDSIEIITYKETAHSHVHHHTQIVLPLQGSLFLEVENSQRLVQAGQACLISSDYAHTHLAKGDNRCLIINNLACWNKDISSTDTFITLSPQAQAYLPFLSSLAQHQTSQQTQANALQLIECLLPIPQETIYQGDQRITLAKQYLDANFQTPCSINELAQHVHLSHSQLTILFKRHLGLTPKQYLLKRRLTQAQHLLETSNKGLEDIALAIGFHDASALSRLFTKQLGRSPGQYREAARAAICR